MASNAVALKPGTRFRTGGVSYEVLKDAEVPADIAPVTPQSTRMLKVTCPMGGCGYTCRVTAKWLAVGAPHCPVHEVAMEAGDIVVKAPAKKVAPAKPAKAPQPVADPVLPAEDEAEYEDAGDDIPAPVLPSPLAQLLDDLQ